MTLTGLALIAAGFDLSHRLTGWKAAAAAWLAAAGVPLAAAGAVSWLVPGFFS